ncbi:TCDD-inducible poly [ADP-ribose] polymerase-like [Stylophora pistillata]|uniref:TCDD-inducible poly [ADP-ribose] polymerase-like n=1 Tax=Stylophora pistillata TaxID=50429 RepID=UPI000C046FAD|nr:TCDD-inducible poly [ADP-ribose] polymerase-like [Stylophora pistillata]
MHQINVQYGTIRKVKRRPERPVYPDELNALNSVHPEFRVTQPNNVNQLTTAYATLYKSQKPDNGVVQPRVPKHWSPMPTSRLHPEFRLAHPDSENQLTTTSLTLHMSREPDNGAFQSRVPKHWSPMLPSEKYTRVTLELYSKEFTEVEELFLASMHDAVIEKIDLLQNPFIWEKYQRKKDNMMGLAHGKTCNVNEKKLFHGTSPDAVEAICKQNFDWRVNGKNATVYGQGSYFKVDASYSHNYAKEDGTMSRFMFLAKVLAGSYTKGEPSFRRPPPKQPWNPTSDLYDSCVDNEAKPNIFVVFETDQCYPVLLCPVIT